MQILKSISLDFGRKSEYKTVYAKRYEAMNSNLEISLLNYGESFNLESDMTAKMQLLKPDGKLVVAECTRNYGGAADKILVEFPAQAFAVPGIGRAEIALYQNGSFLSAQKFYMEIEDNEVADAFSSSNEFRALDEALAQVGTAISAAEEAAAAANGAAENAGSAAEAANNASSAANTAAGNANQAAANANSAKNNANLAAGNANTATESANTAATAANTAAATASAASTDAERVNIAAVQTATGADITTTDRDGAETTVHIMGAPSIFTPDTWTAGDLPFRDFLGGHGSQITWGERGFVWDGDPPRLAQSQYTTDYVPSAVSYQLPEFSSLIECDSYLGSLLFVDEGDHPIETIVVNRVHPTIVSPPRNAKRVYLNFKLNSWKNPEDVSIIILTFSNAQLNSLSNSLVEIKPLYGKKVVCFGDSLFGMHRGATSAPAYAAKECGATVFNVGFGGCRMAVHPTPGYAEFSMWALAKAVSENDFAAQDAGAVNGSAYFPEQLAVLKRIPFIDVDSIVIHYGTNDFASSVQLDNSSNPEDTSTICGALRYSVNKLLTAYPKLQIYVSLPCYRYWTEGGTTTFAEDYTNGNGIKLSDVCNALKDAAKALNLPVIDGFCGLGINKFNASVFLEDGAHHNESGRERFGRFIGAHIAGRGR